MILIPGGLGLLHVSFVFLSYRTFLVSCTEAKPAHEVSSGEDASDESQRTKLGPEDRVASPTANSAERKPKKKRGRSPSRTKSPEPRRSRDSRERSPSRKPASAGRRKQEKPIVLDKEKLAKLEEKVRRTKETIKAKEAKYRPERTERTNETEAEDPEELARLAKEKAKPLEEKKEPKKEPEKEPEKKEPQAPSVEQWQPQTQQGQQCPVCGKTLKSSTDFALSQHLWSVHPEHPEAKRRSSEYKITLKEREKSQTRWSNWQKPGRERSQSKETKYQNWQRKVNEPSDSHHRREPSGSNHRREPSGSNHRRDSRPRSADSRSQPRDRSRRHHQQKSSSGYSRRLKTSGGSGEAPNMLAEFFRTTRQQKGLNEIVEGFDSVCPKKSRDPRVLAVWRSFFR